jgi:hypothetical protein
MMRKEKEKRKEEKEEAKEKDAIAFKKSHHIQQTKKYILNLQIISIHKMYLHTLFCSIFLRNFSGLGR